MRISDWSSDVCSSDLGNARQLALKQRRDSPENGAESGKGQARQVIHRRRIEGEQHHASERHDDPRQSRQTDAIAQKNDRQNKRERRTEEQTSELQSLMRNSYAVFCLKKNKKHESK